MDKTPGWFKDRSSRGACTMAAAVLSVQATTLVTALGSMQLIMMLFTYASCVHQGHCQVWLPMISDTWTHPPASYVSRWVVSIVALGMSLAQILFWKAEDARLCCSSSAWQAIAVFSCFCLAVVGAVCESTIPTCRGNDALHSTSAVVFFALYNSSMAVFTANGRQHDRTGIVLMLLSLCCKVRWFMPAPTAIGVGEPVPVVAIIEWADVILIIVWTAWLVFKRKPTTTRIRAPSEPRGAPTSISSRAEAHKAEPEPWRNIVLTAGSPPRIGRSTYALALVTSLGARDAAEHEQGKGSSAACTAAPLWSASVSSIVSFVLLLFVGTLASCLYFIFAEGRVAPHSWPMISDMWVYPPGDWISRWAVNLGGNLSICATVCLYVMDGSSAPSAKVLTATAVVAILGLDVVGCVNEQENVIVHSIGAVRRQENIERGRADRMHARCMRAWCAVRESCVRVWCRASSLVATTRTWCRAPSSPTRARRRTARGTAAVAVHCSARSPSPLAC